MIDPRVDATLVRRLLRHEAEVHAIPGRELRDLGDAILLHDPVEVEPFWNRVEAIRWPDDPIAFDRRLAEMGVLFASIGRQPHFWTLPPHDEPADLIARLFANGFEDVGDRLLLVARDGSRHETRCGGRRSARTRASNACAGSADPSPMAWRRRSPRCCSPPSWSTTSAGRASSPRRSRPSPIRGSCTTWSGATTSRWRSPAGPRSTASRICRRSGRSSRSGGPGWVDT